MKTQINKASKSLKLLPDIGEPWKHNNSDQVFMRIESTEGARALGHKSLELMYSIDLDIGNIVWTNSVVNIQFLKPTGGKMKFDVV